jgi:hypothetical protein
MTTFILGNGDNLSVSDDNSNGDTVILGIYSDSCFNFRLVAISNG